MIDPGVLSISQNSLRGLEKTLLLTSPCSFPPLPVLRALPAQTPHPGSWSLGCVSRDLGSLLRVLAVPLFLVGVRLCSQRRTQDGNWDEKPKKVLPMALHPILRNKIYIKRVTHETYIIKYINKARKLSKN